MGGPERIVKMLTQVVGNREIEKITSSDDVITTVEENEEEAYEAVKEFFGVEVARIFGGINELEFSELRIEDELQIAEFRYLHEDEKITYLINASYLETSWGIDVEDELLEVYHKEVKGNDIEIKEYKIIDSGLKRYSAKFVYKGLEYFLVGTMSKSNFELILDNLYFYRQ